MTEEQKDFSELLKRLIKEADLTQETFYMNAGIKKPYFYDILKGNPPPPLLQRKFMDLLDPGPEDKKAFYNLSAALRGELPADILLTVKNKPFLIDEIRRLIETTREEMRHE